MRTKIKSHIKIAILFLLTPLLVTCSATTEDQNRRSSDNNNRLRIWWTKGFDPQEYLEGSAGRYFPAMPQLLAQPFWQDESDPHISEAVKQFREGATRPMYQALNPAYSQVLAENVWDRAPGTGGS